MGCKNQKVILGILALLSLCSFSSAQEKSEKKDSLVRLLKAESLQLVDTGVNTYRKTIAATFLHNDTYLLCDTAYWYVDRKIINAWGNVQVIQDGTILTSDRLDYLVDDNIAQFRGTLVQLKDKDNNILRTRHLDYNTKDSTAVFKRGGAMRDKDGQLVESENGSYDSASRSFSFQQKVNMFTDSVFVKTENLDYYSSDSRMDFTSPVDFWKEGDMLSAQRGWYLREEDKFFFHEDVHATSKDQEVWTDSLYYFRRPNDILMFGETQVQDSTKNMAALAKKVFYCDSLQRLTMTKDAAVAYRTEENGQIDTVYFGADSLVMNSVFKCDLKEDEIKASENRLSDILSDAVSSYRQKAAKAAAEAAAKAAEEDVNRQNAAKARNRGPRGLPSKDAPQTGGDEEKPAEEATVSAPVDTLPPPPDSSKVNFVLGVGHVKVFRRDIQMLADSMKYNDLDSIGRFYKDPLVWNEGNRQYAADSIFTLIRNSRVDRASLMGNAFIAIQEDSTCFDQIKGTEVMAYFDEQTQLRRFDALGGATTIFFLEENGAFATINKVDTKMLSGTFKKGELDRVYYFESPKNDAYPVAQTKKEDRFLKGFAWKNQLRPKSRKDVTPLEVRPSERSFYEAKPRPDFLRTEEYFPGYIDQVYKGLAASDSLKRVRQIEREKRKQEQERLSKLKLAADSTLVSKDTTAVVGDSLAVADDRLAKVRGSVALAATNDSLSVDSAVKDSAAVVVPVVPTAKELRAKEREKRKAELAAKKEAKQKALEEKWAKEDELYKQKQEKKREKALEKKRAKVRRALELKEKAQAKEDARLERYREKYRKRKAREDARAAKKEEDKPIEKPIENGEVNEQVPALRSSGHAVERGLGKPTVSLKRTEPSEDAPAGAPGDGR